MPEAMIREALQQARDYISIPSAEYRRKYNLPPNDYCQSEERLIELMDAALAATQEGQKLVTDEMVNRFLNWKLPENFSPDCGISFKKMHSENGPWGPQKHEPTGTNLFDANQARAMLEYVFEQRQEGQKPVAYVVQSLRDGSIGAEIAPVDYAMFDQRMENLRNSTWVKAGAARLVPLYLAAEQRQEGQKSVARSTPRTDALLADYDKSYERCAADETCDLANFEGELEHRAISLCRELERELAAAEQRNGDKQQREKP